MVREGPRLAVPRFDDSLGVKAVTKYFPWKGVGPEVRLTGRPVWVWLAWLLLWSCAVEGLVDVLKFLTR